MSVGSSVGYVTPQTCRSWTQGGLPGSVRGERFNAIGSLVCFVYSYIHHLSDCWRLSEIFSPLCAGRTVLQFCAVNKLALCHEATQRTYHRFVQILHVTKRRLLRIYRKDENTPSMNRTHLPVLLNRNPLNPHRSRDVTRTCGSCPRLSKPLMLITLVVIKGLVSERPSRQL